MKLAIFDLDGTLLPIDAGVEWVKFLHEKAECDLTPELSECYRFLADYRAGSFVVEDFVRFHMGLLAKFERQQLEVWRKCYIDTVVKPHLTVGAIELVGAQKRAGFEVVMVTGTQHFLSFAIGSLFGIEKVIATRPEVDERGEFTGSFVGGYSYGSHKIDRVLEFLSQIGQTVEHLESISFFTDSITDLPLIEFVDKFNGQVVATNPDSQLQKEAEKRGWTIVHVFAHD